MALDKSICKNKKIITREESGTDYLLLVGQKHFILGKTHILWK